MGRELLYHRASCEQHRLELLGRGFPMRLIAPPFRLTNDY